jgi:methionine aminopeptidase
VLFSRAAAVRTPEQIAVMRRAGRVVAEMHHEIRGGHPPGGHHRRAGSHRP